MERLDLLALADFNLVARHGGFGRAARAAGRPKATLSRRVADLEAALDVRLFERGGRNLQLTAEGRDLFERSAVLLADLEDTAAAISSGSRMPRGALRITAPLLFSQTAMGRLAAEFARTHPQVQLEVTAEDRPVDPIEAGYDLVIRVNPEPDLALVGRPFLRDRLVVVASPSLPRVVDDAVIPAVVRGAGDRAEAWPMTTPAGPVRLAVRPIARLSSMIMIRDAVRAGAGAGRLPLSLVSRDLASGALVHWGDADAPDIALWALYPSRRLLSARVSAFLDHLKAAFPTGAPEELAAYVTA